MRRIAISLGLTVLLVGALAAPVGAVAPYTAATWKASIGSNAFYGTATLTASSSGTGSLVLRARHLVALGVYSITIRRGTCTAPGTLLATLPNTTSHRIGTISRTYALTVSQMTPVLKAAAQLTLWMTRGPTQRCGVLKAQLPRGVIPVNRRMLIPHTADGAVGMHWLTVLGAEPWDPLPGWEGVVEDGEVALAVHVRMSAVEKTGYGPGYFKIRTPGHVDGDLDIPPQPGREPELPSGSLTPGRIADGWVTFVVFEDELDELVLLYAPASEVLLTFALS
jgi:hypothetical protein